MLLHHVCLGDLEYVDKIHTANCILIVYCTVLINYLYMSLLFITKVKGTIDIYCFPCTNGGDCVEVLQECGKGVNSLNPDCEDVINEYLFLVRRTN